MEFLNNYKTVDFAFGVAPGVYAIVTSDSDEVHDLMKYLKNGRWSKTMRFTDLII